jgi:hypothetical protein
MRVNPDLSIESAAYVCHPCEREIVKIGCAVDVSLRFSSGRFRYGLQRMVLRYLYNIEIGSWSNAHKVERRPNRDEAKTK